MPVSLHLWIAQASSLKGSREFCLIFVLREGAPCHLTWSISTIIIFYCLLSGVTLELFWNMLTAQEMGKCLYCYLSLPVLKPQLKSHYLAKVCKGCCSWGLYSQNGNVDILCFFKFTLQCDWWSLCHSEVGDYLCFCSTAHGGMCQDTKSVAICVCWVPIHVLTPVSCASPQAVLHSMMVFPVSGSGGGVSLDWTV